MKTKEENIHLTDTQALYFFLNSIESAYNLTADKKKRKAILDGLTELYNSIK